MAEAHVSLKGSTVRMKLKPHGGPVYRAMLRGACFKYPDKIHPEAYIRREREQNGTWVKKDEKGVSVAVSQKSLFKYVEPKAIGEIESEVVRAIRNPVKNVALEILADPPEPDSEHGNITDIPYVSEDRDTAEFLSGELARNSKLMGEREFNMLRDGVKEGHNRRPE
jgi:hypothetical protein